MGCSTGSGLHDRRRHDSGRNRLESLLGRAELRPSGLPPAAVLCVRHVLDPLPGALQLDTGDARPPPEWERAFVAALERALRSAARPAREAVPAAAEAVLFADRAELLACLARDALAGTAWLHWWWRDLCVTPVGGGDAVVAAWSETPEHAPAALELLAERGEAVSFVAALAAADATALVRRIAAVHGLAEVRRAVATASPPAHVTQRVRASRAAPVPEPPWREVVPESAARPLAPAAELLLGVALVLRRAPQLARSATFASATRAWLATPVPPRALKSRARREARALTDVVTTESAPVQQHAVAPRVEHAPARATRAKTAPPVAQPTAPPRPRTDAQTTPPPHRVTHARAAESPADAPAPEPQPVHAQRTRTHAPAHASAPERKRVPARAATRTPAPPRARKRTIHAPAPTPAPQAAPPTEAPELVLETGLGGVFYLLNLALFLELYGDFTRPLEPGIALDPWDLLALLAPQLLDEPARGDALWPLLAQLAGRGPRERPGRGFRPPRAWRTPTQWLTPFDHDGTWRWSAARGTLRILHPAGFAVTAVPRTDEPARVQLARELRRLRRFTPVPLRAARRPEPAQPLARWIARLSAYTDARLRRALRDVSVDAMLHQHARVEVTPTHVDVTFRLVELPLEVRIAGLDRTPGWIPAAGRFVAFHFA